LASIGPNTNAAPCILATDCLLCGGEDREEVLAAMDHVRLGNATAHHRYRCYEFWRFPDICVVLMGIGSGTIEPLLVEALRTDILRRIILFGTAGRAVGSDVQIGKAYIIAHAYLAGTALDGEMIEQPVRPAWPIPLGIPTARAASTDFYYGFGPRSYARRGGNLSRRYLDLMGSYDLVDMEVGQFYALCRILGKEELQFVAVKGPANTLGDCGKQVEHSPQVLRLCLARALSLLADARAGSR
jgi:hypothetical protein